MNNHKFLILVGVIVTILSILFVLNVNKNKKQTETTQTAEVANRFLSAVPDWCLDRTSQTNQSWKSLQKDQFKVSYPENFELGNQDYNFANFRSTEKNIEFEVLSPLWTTEVQELLSSSNKNFNVVNKFSKKRTLSCNTEVGESTIQTNTVYLLKSQDKTKKSLVIEVGLNDSQTKSETNRFFVLKINEGDRFLNYKDKFVKFVSSLEQYADA